MASRTGDGDGDGVQETCHLVNLVHITSGNDDCTSKPTSRIDGMRFVRVTTTDYYGRNPNAYFEIHFELLSLCN